jgi:hypothetical protein
LAAALAQLTANKERKSSALKYAQLFYAISCSWSQATRGGHRFPGASLFDFRRFSVQVGAGYADKAIEKVMPYVE